MSVADSSGGLCQGPLAVSFCVEGFGALGFRGSGQFSERLRSEGFAARLWHSTPSALQ